MAKDRVVLAMRNVRTNAVWSPAMTAEGYSWIFAPSTVYASTTPSLTL
jgi:hypothetical protein